MKISCSKQSFGSALALAERFTGKNVALPVLGSVLLSAEKAAISITATNLEYAAKVTVRGDIEKEGRISVPARVLSAFVQSGKEESVGLEERKGGVLVSAGSRKARVNGISAEEFPIIPKVAHKHTFHVDGSSLRAGLGAVLPAVSSSEFKPELGGVFFRLTPTALVLVATDTFRLAEYSIPLPGGAEEGEASVSFILPQRVAQEIARIEIEGPVRVRVGDNQVLFSLGGVEMTSRLIDGAFPEYKGIIPSSFKTTSELPRSELVDAVRSSSVFVSKLQDVALRFSPNALEVASENTDVGDHKTRVSAVQTGSDIELRFNYRYLLDGLGALDEDDVVIGCNDENAPALIRNKSNRSFTYVLSPIRLT